MQKERFFEDLGDKIQKAVKSDMKRILKKIKGERIYAAALVTDSDCVTLYLALNTYEYMEKKDKQYLELFQNDLPEDTIEKVQEGFGSLTKWIPDEWGYSDGAGSKLSGVSKLLFAQEESDPEGYEAFAGVFFETVTSAFRRLIEEKVFGENPEEITFFVSMSDDERAPEIEDDSAKLLNSERVYQEFLKREFL